MNALQKIQKLEREVKSRGMNFRQVAEEAGLSHNALYNRRSKAKANPNGNYQVRRKTERKIAAVLARHKVKYPEVLHARERQLSLPLVSKSVIKRLAVQTGSNGHDKTATNVVAVTKPTGTALTRSQATLMNLIGERLQRMSVVQLALLYAKIVGDDGQ